MKCVCVCVCVCMCVCVCACGMRGPASATGSPPVAVSELEYLLGMAAGEDTRTAIVSDYVDLRLTAARATDDSFAPDQVSGPVCYVFFFFWFFLSVFLWDLCSHSFSITHPHWIILCVRPHTGHHPLNSGLDAVTTLPGRATVVRVTVAPHSRRRC